jgi:hypothetical protein
MVGRHTKTCSASNMRRKKKLEQLADVRGVLCVTVCYVTAQNIFGPTKSFIRFILKI